MKPCPVAGCERIPDPGWAMCRAHVEEWLDRALLPATRAATKAEGYELPRWTPEPGIDELELRAMDGNR